MSDIQKHVDHLSGLLTPFTQPLLPVLPLPELWVLDMFPKWSCDVYKYIKCTYISLSMDLFSMDLFQ